MDQTNSFPFKKFYVVLYLFLATLGLRCCTDFFYFGQGGPLLAVVLRLLWLQSTGSEMQSLSSCRS